MKKLGILLSVLLLMTVFACKEEGSDRPADNFDRQEMLINWADQIIVPALTSFAVKTEILKAAGNEFAADPTQVNLTLLREAWYEAYLAWQSVSMFEIGKAEEVRLRDNLNIYPTDTEGIEVNISGGDYNLELPSQKDKQGFPALDYLLFGLRENDPDLLALYLGNTAYAAYLTDLVDRIDALTKVVLTDWNAGFRDEFVGNSDNTANASVNKLVNDYLFYYEKVLRAGKIGIPAGVFSSGPLPGNVEARFKNDISKALFEAALDACQDFFNGKHFGATTSGQSLKSYLDYLDSFKNEAELSFLIDTQFKAIRAQAANLDASFTKQIETDNAVMLNVFDQLQLNVILLKVDMLQSLNISIDYVDADGD